MTYEEFLNNWRPQYVDWASEADAADMEPPSEEKTAHGWASAERPAHNHFNWHQNRTDRRLAELEARVAWLTACLEEERSV